MTLSRFTIKSIKEKIKNCKNSIKRRKAMIEKCEIIIGKTALMIEKLKKQLFEEEKKADENRLSAVLTITKIKKHEPNIDIEEVLDELR